MHEFGGGVFVPEIVIDSAVATNSNSNDVLNADQQARPASTSVPEIVTDSAVATNSNSNDLLNADQQARPACSQENPPYSRALKDISAEISRFRRRSTTTFGILVVITVALCISVAAVATGLLVVAERVLN